MTGWLHKRRLLPWLVAALFAARAIVPVGYMLSMPAHDSSGFALDFCPLQNAGLDFDRLARADGAAVLHHQHGEAHAGVDTGSASPERSVSLSSTNCADWLSSAVTVVGGDPLRQVVPAVTTDRPSGSALLCATRVLAGGAQPRAPPLSIA